MEMRAEAPVFVPAGTLRGHEVDAMPGEMHGDRLIRQLAAAMAPAPVVAPSDAIPAAGLFCPYCAAGGPCSFHQPTSAGWEMQKMSAADFACTAGGHSRERKKDECGEDLGSARRPLPPAPTGPPPAPPALACVDAAAVSRDLFCQECGAGGGLCLCNGLGGGVISAVAHLLADGRREGPGKGVTELEDVSTDAGGSEPCCAESDVSDASLAGTSVASRRGQGSVQAYGMHSALPYMSTVWMPKVHAPAAADGAGLGAAVWYSARQGACSWGTGAR
mmetsp:Transcript_40360/g.128260  ORF Transcript_40360/g.128260 Transcript_40360/m.128260 type:complete len:276 (-) Transcript_40360:110-937(-)